MAAIRRLDAAALRGWTVRDIADVKDVLAAPEGTALILDRRLEVVSRS